jgi:hypothetical protein
MNHQKIAFIIYAALVLVIFNLFLIQIIGEATARLFLFGWLGCITLGTLYFLIEEKWKGDKQRDADNKNEA